MSSITIIGGGIIGLSSAYYLNKAGFDVTVFDQGGLTEGCSWRNAGMIVPSHMIPLAAPGIIAKGVRWMFNANSPFYVKPRFNRGLIRWGYQFYRHSNRKHVEHSVPALRDLSLYSKSLYQQWHKDMPFNFGYDERGLLMLYKSASTEREELESVHIATRAGVEAHVLSPEEVQKMEPDVRVNVRGGVYYPGDAQLIPSVLVENLVAYLKGNGVHFQTNTSINDFSFQNGLVNELRTNQGDFKVEELVIAGGSWSGHLMSKLGITLLMQAGKGYSFTLEDVKKNTRVPSIFLESRVAVTPMGHALRFGGTMEICGIDHGINMNRVKGIVDSIPEYYPDMTVGVPRKENIWHGLRPCSPDGLPYIGRSKRIKNVIIATGHSMLGLSLAPGTGKLVSEVALHESIGINIAPFDPERYAD